MKHFEIRYFIGNHAFTYKCTTVSEAVAALKSLAAHDSNTLLSKSMDDYIEMLVEMKNGTLKRHETHLYEICYLDGEV